MTVRVSFEGGRADILLDRPDVLNAMDFPMFDALARACDEVADRGARVAVVRGAGRAFCSGIDLGAFRNESGEPRRLIARVQAGFRALAALPMPTIAAVHGYALGAGLQVALACDLRLVTSDAVLGLLEVGFGIVPDLGATQRLPLLVGAGRAKQMMWLQEKIDGAEAHRRGLAEVTCSAERLDASVDELCVSIAEADPEATAAVKRLVDIAGRVPLAEGMDAEAREQERLLARRARPSAVGGDA